MIDDFQILGHDDARPAVDRVIFCDGAGAELFLEGRDLELSHWRPNRTPANLRADTSTEICFRFLEHPPPGYWTLGVNNHLDVDGILSVYTLLHMAHAQVYKHEIIQAAEMGDFWAWGEPAAQWIFQGVTLLIEEGKEAKKTAHEIYAEAFRQIPDILMEFELDPHSGAIHQSLEPLRQGVELVESKKILRNEVDSRLSSYLIPADVSGGNMERATYIPKFNEKISPKGLLWPQVRAKWDDQRVSLVSVEAKEGWHHDLWFPGYLWADIENRWKVPGMTYHDGMESYDLDLPALTQVVHTLNREEKGHGQWTLGAPAFMFHPRIQSEFPVVLRVLDKEGNPTESRLPPEAVTAYLQGVFTL